MSRIVVVDDHPVFRKGLISLLRASDHEVVGEAASGLEALDVVLAERPDLVLMDVSMPDLGGLEATEQLLARLPGLGVVVITLHDDRATVARALQVGASGYVTKQASPDEILAAVAAARSGALWLGSGVPRPFEEEFPSEPGRSGVFAGLTPREQAIAALIGRGLPNPVIAERLQLSVKTVANYVSIVILKLGADDRAEAARIERAARHR